MKIRELTKEELNSIEVIHYDTGFSMWMKQPELKGNRCILDASLFKEEGHIYISPPKGKFKFGTFFEDNKIKIVAIV